MRRLAIIGAGPVGIEAAVAATDRGYDVRVFERGEVGDSMRQWGHVRMFSPFSMNSSVAGLGRLRRESVETPPPDALLAGREFVTRYLEPLAATLGDRIRTRTEVAGLARPGILKGELIADESRLDTPFRLLLRSGDDEWDESADIVFDCSGTFSNPNPLGDGGLVAPGERACADRIAYGAPDVSGYAGTRVLVVGAGHSAATVVRDLAKLPETRVVWLKRGEGGVPCREVGDDALPARSELVSEVNRLATSGRVDFRPGCRVKSLERSNGSVRMALLTPDGEGVEEVDRIVAATGFRPDLALARELQAKTCFATEGSYNLAAALLGETGGDCLAVGGFGVESLRHPEPGYFVLGMKSYGRTPDFLVRTGRGQIESVLEWLESAERL